MTKLADWESRLSALVTQAHTRPFAWGSHDCCLWAADCVLAQTGIDHGEGIRGTYADAREAIAMLDSMGGLDGVGSLFGSRIPPLSVMHGDVGVVRCGDRDLMGLCNGDHWLVTGTNGLLLVPLGDASMAWRVGNA